MDISETTTSQDSSPPPQANTPDYSPVNDTGGVMEPSTNITNTDTTLGNGTSEATTMEPTDLHKMSLNDNNAVTVSAPVEGGASRPSPRVTSSSTGLTPVSNHPLMMSPTGSDSDVSEFIVPVRGKPAIRNYYHYPDVVPASEQPLRLASPYSSRRNVEPNENKQDGANEKGTPLTTVTVASGVRRAMKTSPAKRTMARVSTSKKQHYGKSTTTAATSTLDVINNAIHRGAEEASNGSSNGHRREEAMGSDFFTSDSEPEPEEDVSLFQASVAPTFQSVALRPSSPPGPAQQSKSISPRLHQRRKVPLPSDLLVDDVSSLEETLSNQSVDELQQNLVSLSPSSSILDDNGFNVDIDEDFLDLPGTPKATQLQQQQLQDGPADAAALAGSSLPQYTAREEARDIRNWQKITLPDGKTREIDMKVIEPYKCVLSHGGYLQAGGHNAIVVFSACHLPDRSRADYHYVMNNLFLYVVKTLEQLVTEDYVLVYLHGGSSRGNVPPFPWLKNSKFWRKLVYVRSLEELYKLVPVEKAAVPDKVKHYNAR
ncbi:AGAP005565-PA-like protein [Anopheles sinensis]|uniref:AGAP005565-PA-like protein n=1 Tax=Anopheles sinensis TaxID=74873 RepID=A0A084WKM9_ANOSI|nr:AGAP005565-PA-like protein [Anopheles sinensis]